MKVRIAKMIRVIVALVMAVASLSVGTCKTKYETEAASSYFFNGEGWYNIIPACAPDKALGLASSNIKNGTNVQLVTLGNATKFYFANMGNGYYAISALSSNKVLDIKGGSKNSGANVQMYDYNFGGGQLWRVVNAGNGYYYLKPCSNESLALDVTGAKNAVGTNVEVYNWWSGNNAEKFQLYKGNSLKESYTMVTSANKVPKTYTVKSTGDTKVTVYGLYIPALNNKNYRPSISCEFRVIIKNAAGTTVVDEYVSKQKTYSLGKASSEYTITIKYHNKLYTPYLSTTECAMLVLQNARIK